MLRFSEISETGERLKNSIIGFEVKNIKPVSDISNIEAHDFGDDFFTSSIEETLFPELDIEADVYGRSEDEFTFDFDINNSDFRELLLVFHNLGKRKLNDKEPMPLKGMPTCPAWLIPEAKTEWKRLVKILSEMGVLTEVDRTAFAAYCQSYARWKEAQEHINSEGATYETENGMQRPNPYVAICNTEQRLMMSAASEFGLTPSARSRIMAATGGHKDDEDEMEALLGGDS